MNLKFYSAFGVLTTAFAHMEADIRMLLAGIAFRDEMIIAAAFLDGSHLSENVSILRKISLSFVGDEHRFTELLDIIEKIRVKRNLFVHGLWSPRDFGAPDGFAVVRILRTKHKKQKGGSLWRHGDEERFTVGDFQSILNDVNDVIKRINRLCTWLEKEQEIDFYHQGSTSIHRSVVSLDELQSITESK
jgi:hypothetical protein